MATFFILGGFVLATIGILAWHADWMRKPLRGSPTRPVKPMAHDMVDSVGQAADDMIGSVGESLTQMIQDVSDHHTKVMQQQMEVMSLMRELDNADEEHKPAVSQRLEEVLMRL